MNRSTFRMIKYMNVFSNARYMNGVGFEILARTPVPQLPPSYPHPHPAPSHPGDNKSCVVDCNSYVGYNRSYIGLTNSYVGDNNTYVEDNISSVGLVLVIST